MKIEKYNTKLIVFVIVEKHIFISYIVKVAIRYIVVVNKNTKDCNGLIMSPIQRGFGYVA